jgi:hypothetical protein
MNPQYIVRDYKLYLFIYKIIKPINLVGFCEVKGVLAYNKKTEKWYKPPDKRDQLWIQKSSSITTFLTKEEFIQQYFHVLLAIK